MSSGVRLWFTASLVRPDMQTGTRPKLPIRYGQAIAANQAIFLTEEMENMLSIEIGVDLIL